MENHQFINSENDCLRYVKARRRAFLQTAQQEAKEMNTPENITSLKPHEIFVFGSNLAGRHGAGAALLAAKLFGAQRGVGEGLTGQCYALPTKDEFIKTLPLNEINRYVAEFLNVAWKHPKLTFLVTKIGCGLAGYDVEEIAPMFHKIPNNVILPVEFEQKK